MPKRARSESIVDFIEPVPRLQRVETTYTGGAVNPLVEALDSIGIAITTETTPLHRTNAIYQAPLNASQEIDTAASNTQASEQPVVALVFSLPSDGRTSGEPTPSTIIVATQSSNEQSPFESQSSVGATSHEETQSIIVGPITPNEGSPFESQLTGDITE